MGAPLELKTKLSTTHSIPKDFTCPSNHGVARWIWKTGNSCNDVNNVGRKTETFSHDEYAKVVHDYQPGKWVNGACSSPPETFISCMDFVVEGLDEFHI